MTGRTSGTTGVRNAFTVDLEHWHMATLVRDAVEDPADAVVESTRIVLDLLDRHDVRATFFVVGEVAAEYPDLVARVADDGHEIASHGHTHTPLSGLTRETFERELARSADAICRAAGVDPDGFRAPNFSLDAETAWALDVLAEAGYRYDSSLFPMRTPMYGVPDAPRTPYVVDPTDPFAASDSAASDSTTPDSTTPDSAGRHPADGDPATGLVECPVAVVGDRVRAPVAGGFYARALPAAVLRRAVGALNRRGRPAVLYVHPWEFNPAVRTSAPSLPRRVVSHYGIESLAEKTASLLEAFEWTTLRDVATTAAAPASVDRSRPAPTTQQPIRFPEK